MQTLSRSTQVAALALVGLAAAFGIWLLLGLGTGGRSELASARSRTLSTADPASDQLLAPVPHALEAEERTELELDVKPAVAQDPAATHSARVLTGRVFEPKGRSVHGA